MSYNYNHFKHQAEQVYDLEYFISKFECRVEDSREYRHYARQMPYYAWDGKEPYNVDTQVVPMKAIHLSSDNLERLVREQELMDRLMADAEYGKKLWREESIDRSVRAANPSVEKAYQKYLMLLELARK